jgi:DNA-binding transcriptional MerR regulator
MLDKNSESLPISELFPIRQLSELTQVNTVTIRAWERRYGLLKPQRTDKGHRLYSQADVKRVKAILAFMAKGVAVGKVKALLDQEAEPDTKQKAQPNSNVLVEQNTAQSDSDWTSLIAQLENALNASSVLKIRSKLKDLFLNYPAHLCYREVIEPLFIKLDGAPQQLAQSAILQSAIVDYSMVRINAKTSQKPLADVLLSCAQQSPIWKLAISAIELTDANFKVTFINQPCPLTTWIGLAEQSSASHCIVYNEGVWKQEEAQKVLALSEQYSHVSFCGTAAVIAQISAEKRISSPEKILGYLSSSRS